jgi:ABC-2 type transport system ATP-binding protein
MIQIQNISKKFGEFTALDHLSLKVQKGEFYSLLGPNGAGKTTCINIISGLLQDHSGQVTINGKSLKTHATEIKQTIGIVPQEIALYEDLTAWENLYFWGKINGVDKQKLPGRINETLAFLDLNEHRSKPISSFSGGMKRRINIAAALLHQPDVLFMDEPTVGIDPQSRIFTYEIFKKLHQSGKTIFYTSHNMEEVEQLSDRIGIIDHGKLIAEGSMDELKNLLQIEESLELKMNLSKEKDEREVEIYLKKYFPNLNLQKNILLLQSPEPTKDLVALLQHLDHLHIEVQSAEVKKVNLEMIFLALTGKKLRE